MREHRNNHPETALFRWGNGTAKLGAITQSDDVCADSRWKKKRDQVGHGTTGSEP